MIERDWHGLYSDSWKGEISPEAFSHPAKFARGLIRQIYKHALEQGWIEPGDIVLDPFGGVALGSLDATRFGLNWIGVELEQPFVDLGVGCECTGISKKDWIRFYGRWKHARYLNGRHWCPRCLAQAETILPSDNGQLSFLDSVPTTAYVRDSGRIPHTEPHHYTGNIELWGRQGAILIQGDSRQLCQVLAEAGAVVSSPPYSSKTVHSGTTINENAWADGRRRKLGPSQYEDYSDNPSNLGNLPAGDFDGVVGSPPYAGCHVGADDNPYINTDGKRLGEARNAHLVGKKSGNYGGDDAQLGAMPEGSLDAAIGSPPYAESLASDDPDKRGGLYRDPKRRKDKTLTAEYGESDGQIGKMPEGDFDAAIGSPPYTESMAQAHGGGCLDPENDERYSDLGITKWKHRQSDYGNSEGQLGAMSPGEFDAALGSPPYEGSFDGRAENPEITRERIRKGGHSDRTVSKVGNFGHSASLGYGDTAGQLGTESGETFWTAASEIMQQTYSVLRPGAVAIWVLKGFVRNKQYVDFPDQWRQLGESCGFETIEWIHAWLVEERGTQYTLDGGAEERKIERKSFFRRLAESKGSPRIDFEIVLIQQKAL